MKREYIQPESKYLTVNGQVLMLGTDDEEGFGSAMTNDATFVEEAEETTDATPAAHSVWEE